MIDSLINPNSTPDRKDIKDISKKKKKKKLNTGLELKLTALGTSHELINF